MEQTPAGTSIETNKAERRVQQIVCHTRRSVLFIRYPPAPHPRPALHCGRTPGRGTAPYRP